MLYQSNLLSFQHLSNMSTESQQNIDRFAFTLMLKQVNLTFKR